MNKEAILKETYNSAFNDELEKIAEEKSNKGKYTGIGALIGGGSGLLGAVSATYPTYKALRILGASKAPSMSLRQAAAILGGIATIGTGIGTSAGAIAGNIIGRGVDKRRKLEKTAEEKSNKRKYTRIGTLVGGSTSLLGTSAGSYHTYKALRDLGLGKGKAAAILGGIATAGAGIGAGAGAIAGNITGRIVDKRMKKALIARGLLENNTTVSVK